ncbi:hypothetical protein LUZ60_012915 [Juncus effusus]|nr:hypothetical protein LUZ60_012915 [Juncus effusus]
MQSQHASRARRTLEEIRQKRAADKLKTVSSGSDLDSSIYNHTAERDTFVLQSRVKELESRNADLERENQHLLSKVEEKEVEKDSLMKRFNDISIEKDAAVVAKEDALSQLRTLKRRLKEAEEEQYRAEEEAASLRAELNMVQQQGLSNNNTNPSSFGGFDKMEKELQDLQNQLKEESVLRQEAQQNLAGEQLRVSALMSEKLDLEERFNALNQKMSEEASKLAVQRAFSLEDKERLENQLHSVALMVERLENSRQKLLTEIDSQSSEIERLFEENSNLSNSYQEAALVAKQWENQVRECLKQNEELRSVLDKLRSEKVDNNPVFNNNTQGLSEENLNKSLNTPPEILASENALLKEQIVKEQSRSEGLAAEVMKLSADLRRAVQSHNNLTRMYRPVLKEIETNLMKMKQETYSTI